MPVCDSPSGRRPVSHVTPEVMVWLAARNTVMAGLVSRYGRLTGSGQSDVYKALVTHIVGQMLSNRAASTLLARLTERAGGAIRPESLLRLTEAELAGLGLSRRKAEYIRGLTRDVFAGKYDFTELEGLDGDEAVRWLTRIRGVGIWTAEMVAAYTLGCPDIFSYADVALINGIRKAHGIRTLSRPTFERLRKQYSPHCSAAALYYYALNDDRAEP